MRECDRKVDVDDMDLRSIFFPNEKEIVEMLLIISFVIHDDI